MPRTVDTDSQLHQSAFTRLNPPARHAPERPPGISRNASPASPESAGTRQGKTVLVQLRDAKDPESSQRYTVKRYESEKTAKGDSWWHERITLKPVNPDFEPIVLTGKDDGELQVIAELVEVLGGND